MTAKHEKEAYISAYSKAYPDESATAIYEHFKGSPYALRKTDTLRVIRDARGKQVSPKKREISVPKKYRHASTYGYPVKELPTFKPTKNENVILNRLKNMPGSYAVATIKVKDKEYFVKFHEKRELRAQTYILKHQYHYLDREADTVFTGPFAKHGDRFVTPEFLQEARRRGIDLD